ncbi:MAG TPA: DoxX family protein [Longimicrobiales bacterium]|nr:DoxX family protein [Longimicrobiales bacterium]
MPAESTTPRLHEITLNAWRIAFGLMFMQHGAQKLFAVFGREQAVEFFSQMGLAGVLEFYGGALIVLGLMTRPVAFVLAGEMAWAFFQAHVPRGWVPIVNRGELPVLYCFAFLHMAARGGGSFSLDGLLSRRRAAQSAA